ncbi:MAG: sporulation protein YqfC [Defluviitaleaceae bacterium]|nr:sporulation protein YqfC [Defluviitaleaceae bacterium]
MRKLKEKAVNILSLPKEIALDMPLMTATGRNEISIENYKNLLEFTETKIRIHTREGIMTIEGERLRLRQITTENVLVHGLISGIKYS